LASKTDLERNLALLTGRAGPCTLCPRRCRADRTAGEAGFCGLPDGLIVARALPHFGEEPPVSGTRGAGTIFLSSCNLRCIYCQNHQVSLGRSGDRISCAELAERMLGLQQKGCHNIEAVTATSQSPQFFRALAIARRGGLRIPLVYNCGGYEDPEIIGLLDGAVDIWLPDFKYGDGWLAREFSAAPDYPETALAAIAEMVLQAGEVLETDGEGIGQRGVIVRHLVLPGNVENSLKALDLLAGRIPRSVPLSIMSQYTPMPSVRMHPDLGRRVTRQEYEGVVERALDAGFETIFTQEVNERSLAPDFDKEDPFV